MASGTINCISKHKGFCPVQRPSLRSMQKALYPAFSFSAVLSASLSMMRQNKANINTQCMCAVLGPHWLPTGKRLDTADVDRRLSCGQSSANTIVILEVSQAAPVLSYCDPTRVTHPARTLYSMPLWCRCLCWVTQQGHSSAAWCCCIGLNCATAADSNPP